jgi:hypothetical protein
VNQFKEQEEQLLGQIHSLNEYIRHLNSRTEKISPHFSQDLSHKKSNKSKNKYSLTRDNYNFQHALCIHLMNGSDPVIVRPVL